MSADIQEFHDVFLTQDVISADQEWNGFLFILDKVMRKAFAALVENRVSNTAVRRDALRRLAQTKVKGHMPNLGFRKFNNAGRKWLEVTCK